MALFLMPELMYRMLFDTSRTRKNIIRGEILLRIIKLCWANLKSTTTTGFYLNRLNVSYLTALGKCVRFSATDIAGLSNKYRFISNEKSPLAKMLWAFFNL